jgi:hypothetical protein
MKLPCTRLPVIWATVDCEGGVCRPSVPPTLLRVVQHLTDGPCGSHDQSYRRSFFPVSDFRNLCRQLLMDI